MRNVVASEFVHSKGLIVESGTMLAEQIACVLATGEEVQVVLAGMRGLSSSYFNAMLGTLLQHVDLPTVETCVHFAFATQAQEQVYGRSLAALRNAVA